MENNPEISNRLRKDMEKAILRVINEYKDHVPISEIPDAILNNYFWYTLHDVLTKATINDKEKLKIVEKQKRLLNLTLKYLETQVKPK